MEDCVDFVEFVVCKVFDKIGFVQVVVDLVVDDVFEFVGLCEVVDGDDVGFVVFVQVFNDVGVDKVGCVSDDDGYDLLIG